MVGRSNGGKLVRQAVSWSASPVCCSRAMSTPEQHARRQCTGRAPPMTGQPSPLLTSSSSGSGSSWRTCAAKERGGAQHKERPDAPLVHLLLLQRLGHVDRLLRRDGGDVCQAGRGTRAQQQQRGGGSGGSRASQARQGLRRHAGSSMAVLQREASSLLSNYNR